jgi:hypothetical protein
MKNQLKMIKVKIKSLAEESKIIRTEERRALGRRVQPKEVQKADTFLGRDDQLRVSLWQHRTIDVRREARHALLAYAFLRGKPFTSVERIPKYRLAEPDWERVRKLVEKFGSLPGIPTVCTRDNLILWRDGKLLAAV